MWSHLPTSLTLSDAKDRILIREFVLRFSPLVDISKTNLVELECIAGVKQKALYDDEDDEDDEMVGWVSEACVKSVLLAVLGLLDDGQNATSKVGLRSFSSLSRYLWKSRLLKALLKRLEVLVQI
jgi:hypothetical protein